MISIHDQIVAIEALLSEKRVHIKELCQLAGVAVSNWARWKKGTSPTISKWAKIQGAVEHLCAPVSDGSDDRSTVDPLPEDLPSRTGTAPEQAGAT